MKTHILQNLSQVQQRINVAEQQYGRAAGAVKLLAVSKAQSSEKIRIVAEAGQQLFGENYLQEALQKQAQLTDLPIEWHFIGAIQSNKVKLIAQHFSWVHTVSRLEVAEKLNRYRQGLLPLNICIQVNSSGEPTKAGVLPDQVATLANRIMDLPNLRWRGLMVIPAPTLDIDEQHRQCAVVRQLFDALKMHYPALDTLSMGMSADLDVAIAEGATLVRIGSAIFGNR